MADTTPCTTAYTARRQARSRLVPLRTLNQHLHEWGDARLAGAARPPLVLLHGWMDVGASFQFVVDALAEAEGFERWVIAPDWRGFGLTQGPPADSYWFPDYLGDLDALLDHLWPDAAVDLLGHSMGGNVAMTYAGLRPGRLRRLINLEGFGMPATQPEQAPERLLQWLDELKRPATLKPYPDLAAVAARLMANNPLLGADKAAWLATHWSRPAAGGGFELAADPAHKRVNPVLYRVEEALACWRRIAAPLLWVEGDRSAGLRWWGGSDGRAEFERRLAVVPQVERAVLAPAGHMLHHDQPAALAQRLAAFLA